MDIELIGCYLQQKRKEKGYTQSELAELLNVSHQAVSRWENGENLPDVMKIMELSKLYGVSVDEILHKTVESNQSNEVQTSKVKIVDFKIFTVVNAVIILMSYVLAISLKNLGTSTSVALSVHVLLVLGSVAIYLVPYIRNDDRSVELFRLLKMNLLLSTVGFVSTIGVFNESMGVELIVILVVSALIIKIILDQVENNIYHLNIPIASRFHYDLSNRRLLELFILAVVSGLMMLGLYHLNLVNEYAGIVSIGIALVGVVFMIHRLIKHFSYLNILLTLMYCFILFQIIFWHTNYGTVAKETWESYRNLRDVFEFINISFISLVVIIGLLTYILCRKHFINTVTTTLWFLLFTAAIFVSFTLGNLRLSVGSHHSLPGLYHVELSLESGMALIGVVVLFYVLRFVYDVVKKRKRIRS